MSRPSWAIEWPDGALLPYHWRLPRHERRWGRNPPSRAPRWRGASAAFFDVDVAIFAPDTDYTGPRTVVVKARLYTDRTRLLDLGSTLPEARRRLRALLRFLGWPTRRAKWMLGRLARMMAGTRSTSLRVDAPARPGPSRGPMPPGQWYEKCMTPKCRYIPSWVPCDTPPWQRGRRCSWAWASHHYVATP